MFEKSARGKFVEMKILGVGECFGEEEILEKKGVSYARIFRVICKSDSGVLYSIPRK